MVFFGVLLEVSVGHFASFHPLRPVFHGSSQVFFGEASAIERVKALRTSICEQERLRAFASLTESISLTLLYILLALGLFWAH